MSLDLLVVLVMVLVAPLLIFTFRPDVEAEPVADRPRAIPEPVGPAGQQVRESISADGDLEVSYLVSTSVPVANVFVRVDQVDGDVARTAVEDVEFTAGGTTLATLSSIGSLTQQVALGRAVRQFTVTYHLSNVVAGGAATHSDRALAFVPALSIDYPGETGPTHHRVVGPGKVLNVGCVGTGGAPPRPCGSPSGEAWQVDLSGKDRDNALVVQLQLG